ncbi:MobA/MobL family protein [Sphingomonas phyllosphaerae]|uniref:MobA/MobL family protein n=1 Tax=Sphingomonas phyllosphaerae TaxID=257003 RepID=UPI0003B6FD5E
MEKRDRANANVYIVEVIALPAELSAEQRRQAARRLCRGLQKRGLAYTASIHLPDVAGYQRNYHLHLIYSMRACRRLAAYEWDFATAKHTEINTFAGIMQRRCGVVVAINETLRDAGIAKRYTPLSNRERGMAPPARGKVGQVDTAIARRLAALEAREAQLAALREHARWIRRTLLDAADRLRAARQRMIRRLAQAAIGLAQDEAERIQPAELRAGGVRAALEHACDVVDRTTATADDQLVEAHRAVRSRVRLVASQMPMPLAGAALEDRRNVVIHRLKAAAMDASGTSRRVQADLDLGRNRLAAIEDEAASVDIAPVPTSTVEEEAALRPGHEITVAERQRADDAARETTASLARRAMTARKHATGAVAESNTRSQTADPTPESRDPSFSSTQAMPSDRERPLHDQRSNKENHDGSVRTAGNQDLPQPKAFCKAFGAVTFGEDQRLISRCEKHQPVK